MSSKKLNKIRKKIDRLDKKIIKLLEKRITQARNTKKHKKHIKDSKREEEILQKIKSPFVKNIYKEIFKSKYKI